MVESTHCLVLGESTVTKTFTLRHGDEEEREWTGLSLLDRWAPGLAPRPLHRGETPGVVSVTMSRVPGLPLAGATLTGARLEGVLDALLRMRDVVPPEVLDTLPTRRGGPTELPVALRAWLPPTTTYAGRGEVTEALEAVTTWLTAEPDPVGPAPADARMLAHGDGDLANFVWDGARCCVVDHEDGGVSDLAYELADVVEHATVALPGLLDERELGAHLPMVGLAAEPMSGRFGRARALLATFWLLMLLPGNPGHHRNPSGSLEQQAVRVLDRLRALG